MWARNQVAMPVSSRFHPPATCSLASAASRSPHRRRRRVASPMGQSPSAPSGRDRNRSWRHPQQGLGRDLGFLLRRKPRSGGERLDLANCMRCVLSPPLMAPTAEAEVEADAEGNAAGNREENEVGDEEADHLVVMVNGLYGSSADWKFAADQFVKRLPGKVFVHRSQCNYSKLTYDGVDMGEG